MAPSTLSKYDWRSLLHSLLVLLRRFQAHKRLLSAAGLAAVTLLLRHLFSKEAKLVTNLNKVGRRVGEGEKKEYDVIIIGGGTSGCVLASRISEDPSIRVLLLEAGGSGKALFLSQTPSGYSKLFYTRHSYALRTEPQTFASGQRRYWPRGKFLGGCSSINAQMAQYGAFADFDEWAKIIGDETWAWEHFSRYFRKFECYSYNANFPKVDVSARGNNGPVQVGYFSAASQASKLFIEACMNIGVPFSPDFNGPTGTLGVNRISADIYKQQRQESISGVRIPEILFDKDDVDNCRAIGVEFAKSSSDPHYQAFARHEVVLSAGAVNSPHLLMLSGVGPAQHLQEHKIPVIHDLAGVGQRLIDHPVVDTYLRDKAGYSLSYLVAFSLPGLARALPALVQYLIKGTGPLTTNVTDSAAFVRSDDPALFPPTEYPLAVKDTTSAPESPDLELFMAPGAYKEHGAILFTGHTFSLHACLLRPTSAGAVRLKSASSWNLPSVDPKYCQTPEDVEKLTRGLELCLKIAHKEPLASMLDHNDKDPELDHELHLKSHAELTQVVKDRVETLYHPVGTCRMAPLDQDGVVDSQLRVYGVRNLRICDASIFPEIISGHTAGACFAIGEKTADIVKRAVAVSKSRS